jgi:hypothetical protein
MMKVAIHDVVDVVAVRNGGVLAARAVLVRGVVRAARVGRRTARRIVLVYLDGVLLDLAAVHVVEVAIGKVILVASVLNRRVPASPAVGVQLALVSLLIAHGLLRTGASTSVSAPTGDRLLRDTSRA